ncbi:hypothetical protein GCK72_022996 [Caenorhabditis remanei]|uniref:Uncharacterized protein n=1 Tax=Caenorhabditis remanei TaxID=31234 RepID=A0A6A5FV82_CAERE|nr:hypothetical protein GCK72_022996 [Caenorhabditis remanei]KAF1746540.1 hypothetical protein GCK72_022996 [Caenorhabditis remanei]
METLLALEASIGCYANCELGTLVEGMLSGRMVEAVARRMSRCTVAGVVEAARSETSQVTMSEPTHKNDDTKWKIYSMSDKTLGKDPKYPNSLTNWVISDGKSLKLLPNHYALPEDIRKTQKMNYFLIDYRELRAIKSVESSLPGFTWKTCADFFGTLETFAKMLKMFGGGVQKKCYLRVISANVMGDEQSGESRVFADEVAIMIPFLREQQGMPFENPADEQDKIFKRFNPLLQFFSTITLDDLENLLKEYDIDKSLLTLVDDPVHVIGWRSLEMTGAPFKVINAISTQIISKKQAILYMFQHLVCGVNWEDVSLGVRSHIIGVVGMCSVGPNGDYLAFDAVVNLIVLVNQMYPQFPQWRKNEAFNLPLYVFVNMNLPALPVWMLRALLTLGWLHSIVQNDAKLEHFVAGIAEATITALMATIPRVDRKFIRNVQKEALGYIFKQLGLEEEQGKVLDVHAQQQEEKSVEKPGKNGKTAGQGDKS